MCAKVVGDSRENDEGCHLCVARQKVKVYIIGTVRWATLRAIMNARLGSEVEQGHGL